MHIVFRVQSLLINAKIAEKFNLKKGQNITEESLYRQIFKANVEYSLLEIETLLRKN